MSSFYERPILNSPYRAPKLHHPLDQNGQPLEGQPRPGRRPSRFIVPVPASRKKASAAQASLDLETYTENALINEIRGYIERWRNLRNPADWGVTAISQRLLEHWRHHDFVGPRPFFCQIEAVETIIWLTEVAPKRAATKGLLDQIAKANEEANPELFRLAMKMATGSGKTTVMAMLIAWQAVNAARKDSKDFSRAFLIVTPGITIKDRLRVLQPSEPDNYYETREIVPPEMLPDVRRAEIVITNYHAFQHRETLALPKVARSFLQGNAPEPIKTTETDADMLERACGKLLHYDRVNVLNDEAHHCYRHKVGADTDGLEDERRGIISVFDGPAPEVQSLSDVAAEAATVRQSVETWLGEGIASHEIGLFVRTPQLVTRARAAIAGLADEDEMTTAPMSLAKGLEFRAVVVMACDEGILPLDERVADAADEAELDDSYETERRLLYVACTRAREHLLLTGVTPTSEYLADVTS